LQFVNIAYDDKIKEEEVGETCSTHERDEK
jgi:hypothetical protein